MNLTWQLVQRLDGDYGVMLPNGSYGGIVGSTARGDVEFAATALTVTLDRYDFVDYTVREFPALLCIPLPDVIWSTACHWARVDRTNYSPS